MGHRAVMTLLHAFLLGAGAWSDVRRRRIPNALSVTIGIVGLVAARMGVSGSAGLPDALLGVLVGLACWVPFWSTGTIGAGDVKFFAAGAAWIGAEVWRSALLAALLGGAWGLVHLILRDGVLDALRTVAVQLRHPTGFLVRPRPSVSLESYTLPYAVPMAAALLVQVWWPEIVS